MYKNSSQFVSADIIRILICMGVFNGHFCGISLIETPAQNLLSIIRNTNVSKSVISYLFMGDMGVIIFLVLGGFFITYDKGSNNRNNSFTYIIINRLIKYIVPYLLVITGTMVTWNVLSRLYIVDANNFKLNLIHDVKCLIRGVHQYMLINYGI